MTTRKWLKKRVRERQAKTGESYTAALAQIRKPQIEVAPDATAEAQAAGLRCTAVVSERLRGEADLQPLFAPVRRRKPLIALGVFDDVEEWPQLSLMGIGR